MYDKNGSPGRKNDRLDLKRQRPYGPEKTTDQALHIVKNSKKW